MILCMQIVVLEQVYMYITKMWNKTVCVHDVMW